MEIIRKESALHKEKPDGTRVDYYLQPEYELHYNEIPPKTTQEWHLHQKIEEVVFIVEGSLEAEWIQEDGNKKKELIQKGDLVRVGNSFHTFSNNSNDTVSFIVIKLVISGKNNSQTFKDDKVLPKQ